MRVIAGRARGTKLIAPQGLETRPTSDRIKESLFNIITFDVYDAYVLDLFSGSGAIGIEALSRGAKETVFVDQSKEACQCIQHNIEKTKFEKEAILLNLPVEEALHRLGTQKKQFNIIFMDPPYNMDIINDTLKFIIENDLLASNGIIIIERAATNSSLCCKDFEIWKEKKYGITTISFLKGPKTK